jgi:hypothetical protein
MATTAGKSHAHSPADQGRTRHVLLHDDLGRLTLRPLRPRHRIVARWAAARLDRELADGAGPLYREASGDDLGDIIENVTRALTR